MATVRKTITLTEQQNAWIAAQIDAGSYTNDSEAIRDLIRREQERKVSMKSASSPTPIVAEPTNSSNQDDDESEDWEDHDEDGDEEEDVFEDNECGVCNGTGNGIGVNPYSDERMRCVNCDGSGRV